MVPFICRIEVIRHVAADAFYIGVEGRLGVVIS